MKSFTLSAATLFCALVTQSYAAPANNVPVSPIERAKIEEVVRQYLINQPEVLVEALQTLQRKQFQQAEQTVKQTQKNAANYVTALFHQPKDPVAGNATGRITVVEFFDYQCPHCIDMAPVMADIIKANPDLRVVYKEFPIRGPMSNLASRAALAANLQGKYEVFSHNLLTINKPLSEAVILEVADQSGIKNADLERFKKDMNSKAVIDQLQNNMKLAQNLKLLGTPAFFIGKTDGQGSIMYVPGQMDQKQMQDAIDKASK